MVEQVPTREEALTLLHEYNKSDSLRKHALSVEAVMRYIARKRGEDAGSMGSPSQLIDIHKLTSHK